jgi:MFS family permease
MALVVSIYEVGCIFGAIAVLLYGEKLGRKRALVLGGSIVIVGTILQVSSYTRAQFIVGRIVTGLGNGINTSTLGIYQSETCPAKSRGKLVTLEGIMAIGGAMISYWLDFAMSYTNSTAQWRFPLAFQAVFAMYVHRWAKGFLETLGRHVGSYPETETFFYPYALVFEKPANPFAHLF